MRSEFAPYLCALFTLQWYDWVSVLTRMKEAKRTSYDEHYCDFRAQSSRALNQLDILSYRLT